MRKKIFYLMIIAIPFLCWGQSNNSGSSTSDSKKIPHYNFSNEDSIESVSKIPIKTKQDTTYKGYSKRKPIKLKHNIGFIESPLKLGFPIGWSTNSTEPILFYNDKDEPYLELTNAEELYLARLIEIIENEQFLISYSAKQDVVILIIEYDTQNNILAKKNILLEAGNHEKYNLSFDMNHLCKRVFFKIILNKGNNLIISEFKVEGGE